jgi:hypothetical protein
MKRTKEKKEKVEHAVVPEAKKSKFTLYWEEGERLGYPPAQILNMRSVLR